MKLLPFLLILISCNLLPFDHPIEGTYNVPKDGSVLKFDAIFLPVFAYWYSDKKFGYKWMGETIPDNEDSYEIKASGNYYRFKFNDKTFTTKRAKNIERGVRARLYPYFEDGKGRGAPHTMIFYIFEYN